MRVNLGGFLRDQDGAVAIDWVALTMGVLMLGMAVVYSIYELGVSDLVDATNSQMVNSYQPPNFPERPEISASTTGG